ncbi:MAG: hypothetical protein WA240_07035 [Nitrospirota bacterium]
MAALYTQGLSRKSWDKFMGRALSRKFVDKDFFIIGDARLGIMLSSILARHLKENCNKKRFLLHGKRRISHELISDHL